MEVNSFQWSDLTMAEQLVSIPERYSWNLAINGEYIDVELRKKIIGELTRLIDYATFKDCDDNFNMIIKAMYSIIDEQCW